MALTTTAVKLLNKLEKKINPATEDTLKKIIGFEIGDYDQIDLTYVATGDGAGEIETVIYKSGGTTVATLTLSYNGDNKLISITKS